MPANPRHGRRIFAIWFVLAAIATPLVVLVGGPHLPPQQATVQAQHQQQINTILAGVVTPIWLAIAVYSFYALVTWRSRESEAGSDGALLRGNRKVVTWWIVANVIIVSSVVAYGTYDWIGPGVGSGSAQGPAPLARPKGATPLEVQVIAQQWQFTFRYPSYGGIETPELMIPEDRYVEFHVTSLDVVHSFWAVSLGVKADAVGGADNIVYVRADKPGPFRVQCSELCGLYHGQMYQVTSAVLTEAGFEQWIARQQQTYGGIVSHLPPYAHVYSPAPDNLAG
ncbi:MAG: cytochrome c oxidase subunit [Actinomycetota bacterium]|nr:cytochrome c oxidase subunit [Actinomycetota bacterium]